MKKLYLILCAGILALAAVSCKKDAQPVEPAKPMSATEIKQKLANTAVDALNEVDPDNWNAWAQTGMKLVNSIRQVEGGNIQEISEDLRDAMTSIVEGDTKTTTTTLIKLSLVKGDITVEDNNFKYTKSNNPLNITYVLDGKTYKAQLESEGDNGDGITVSTREYEPIEAGKTEVKIVKVAVPTKAAIHVTENGKLFLDAVIYPTVEDKNGNGELDENDAIKGSATIQIPDYTLTLSDLLISDASVKAAISLSHSGKAVLAIDAQASMDLFVERVKSFDQVSLNYIPKSLNGNVSVLGGTALLKANANVEKLQEIKVHYESEDLAKSAAATIAQNLKADLYFDNNPTIQASLCVMVQKNVSEGWDVVAGVHLYDGSADVPASEFFDLSEEVWEPVSGKFSAFLAKINKAFGK
ncbi:MAG: hypothetical protein VZR22_06150 [Candidatus Cryptobacteroides sp.]|nr:hypothetical protein [Candidatus Cryptobacteroides sp.]